MSWSSRRIKEGIFFTVYLSKGNFFKIFDLSQCIVHWIQFPNLHTFTYQKILLHIHFWLFLISLKVFSVSLIHCGFLLPLNYGVDSNNFRIAKYAITFPQDREENDKLDNIGTVFNKRSYVFGKKMNIRQQSLILYKGSKSRVLLVQFSLVTSLPNLRRLIWTSLQISLQISSGQFDF